MSLNAKFSTEYISIGCNRIIQVAAWGIDGLLVFGAHNLVALYYPQDESRKGVFTTLPGHTDRVNCLQFINRGHELDQRNIAIISGSADKTARIWKNSSNKRWVNSAVLIGHTGAINTLGVVRGRSILGTKDLVVTGSADGTIKIWQRSIENDLEDHIECIQTINFGARYPLSLALSYLPDSKVLIMACGSTDKRIYLYIQKNGMFHESLLLQGHENWIRSLAFATYTKAFSVSNSASVTTNLRLQKQQNYQLRDGDLLLASASQDKYVRLWKISCIDSSGNHDFDPNTSINGELSTDILFAFRESIISGDRVQLSTRAHIIDVDITDIGEQDIKKKKYSVMFEALLMAHDDWVYSVCWQPPKFLTDKEKSYYYQPMCILTASSDKSMMLWKPDTETGQWINSVRVGEIGGYALGFLGGLFGPDGKHILAHGHTGAFHLWRNEALDEDSQDWQPQVSISGHFNAVQSITWNPTNEYLISVSLDQTARLFAPWLRTKARNSSTNLVTWHEISRTQIHGYDINCIAFINQWTYVCGSDEKVLRVFDAPKTFLESLSKLTKAERITDKLESRPVGANLPALGLSNKAIFQGDIDTFVKAAESEEFLSRQSYAHSSATPNSLVQTMERPPFEEHLLQHTLWPEIEKLYGHGYELVSVGASHDGKYVASACRATSSDHAVIRIYTTDTWKEISPPLRSHSLTVIRIKFSHDDNYLLTVSRDRFWSLFERSGQGPPYKLVARNKAHSRIIWDCSWSHDDRFFVTASRDKTVKIWPMMTPSQNQWGEIATVRLSEAVTAVDFAPSSFSQTYILALGLESGQILICHSEPYNFERWHVVQAIDKASCPAASINCLAWRVYIEQSKKSSVWQLASCAADWSVRIYNADLSYR
ncbi:hypothetical protein G9A89_012289 [Geosiphon pyriformis]|nr:hypothetical protein G9A89_012289 [Geosiphon pyriformis]